VRHFARGKRQMKMNMEWISVKDSVPELGQIVAFVIKSTDACYHSRVLGGRYRGKCIITGSHNFSVPGFECAGSHWMPLPDAPVQRSARDCDKESKEQPEFPNDEHLEKHFPKAENKPEWEFDEIPEKVNLERIHQELDGVPFLIAGSYLATFETKAPKTYARYIAWLKSKKENTLLKN